MKEIDFSKYEDMLDIAAPVFEESSTDGKTRPGGTICSVCGADRTSGSDSADGERPCQ